MTAFNRGRDLDIYRRNTLYGWTQERIAAEYGLSRSAIANIIARVGKAQAEHIDRAEMIAKSIELADEVRVRALTLADKEGAPVTAGKDGDVVRDPATGEVVRDYSLAVKSLDLALKADEQLARRMGLNAPTETNVTGTVRYQLEGVDPEDLT